LRTSPLVLPSSAALPYTPLFRSADGDTLTVTANTTPSHGTVTVNANGSLSYVPAANYAGADSLTYTISDGNGGTATATVNITITDSKSTRLAVNDSQNTNDDIPL